MQAKKVSLAVKQACMLNDRFSKSLLKVRYHISHSLGRDPKTQKDDKAEDRQKRASIPITHPIKTHPSSKDHSKIGSINTKGSKSVSG